MCLITMRSAPKIMPLGRPILWRTCPEIKDEKMNVMAWIL